LGFLLFSISVFSVSAFTPFLLLSPPPFVPLSEPLFSPTCVPTLKSDFVGKKARRAGGADKKYLLHQAFSSNP
jgi:hypothetical protein